MKKIDIHIHTSKDSGHKINGQELINKDQMIKSMAKRGVDKSVLMSSSAKESDLLSNDELRQICQDSDRFYYMSMVDFEKDIYEQLKREKDLGSIGVGELVYNKPFNSPEIFELLEAAESLEMPVLFHMSPQIGKYYGVYDLKGLLYLEEALNRFKNLIFIGHSQAFWCEISKYDDNDPSYRDSYPEGPVVEGRIGELMRKYPNLYADLSANSGANAIMRDKDYGISFIKEFSDRLFFGTDTYNKDQEFPLDAYLEKLGQDGLIEKEELEKIYYKNFERVFKIKEKQGC
ncbi:amidohydrolase family protein [Anaerococcus sp. NML200574]|uniref:Amidohydrolase family protein n=1 Tax=Anaerococcus kampingae TaxID=3115614 RepID=A0ABW9MFW8_9FIRM|nr:amidohydrolase family protein [Anaerococcus sp. NML200574]MCW6678983.1 amidohydrolase family protein [Anaerococcus sp. NML200574]